MTTPELNAVELEIARNRLASISEEVGTALIRTSYSPNIKDRRDCSAGIYTPTGRLVSQAEHIPLHLGLMPTVVKNAIADYGADNLRPGDILITNNPYLGGPHLPDISVITPVFEQHPKDPEQPRLIAIVANLAHHVDVGGIAPGSMASYSTEIFQEGIRIPPIRLYTAGDLQRETLNLILANIRTADKTRGDLMAQVAANRLGERRIHELVDEWGVDGFAHSCESLIAYGERRTRAAIAQLPDGTGTFTDYLEHNGVSDQMIPITVTITVSGEEITFDFTETGDQVEGAVNCSFAVAEACVAYVIKTVTDPTLPSNAGLTEPMTILTRPSSLVHAQFPAPVAHGNTQTSQRVVDAILGAFNEFTDGVVPAASSGSMSMVTIGGMDPDTGRYYSYVETYGGGQGAGPQRAGADATHTHMTNTRNTPCEVIEREYPLRVDTYAIARDTGGAGHLRGGDGIIRKLTLTRGSAMVTAGTSRVTTQPWGLHGGQDGAPARVTRTDADGEHELASMSGFRVRQGESVSIHTAGGGGFGS